MSQAQTSQPVQAAQPTFINLPQPPSNPDTPSETPGTPTSTTTSLSAVSTTAIKDGHRGGHVPPFFGAGSNCGPRGGHQHNASTNSLEAERADRISRLTGLSGMTALRPSYAANRGSAASGGGGGAAANRFSGSGISPYTTPTSSGGGGGGGFMSGMVVPGPLTPAFFDAQGQPVAITKMSTVGTASATDSISGRTLEGDGDTVDGETMTEDDDDILSMGTNYHYSTGRGGGDGGDDVDAMMMDDDNLDAASRSAGGYEDRMSDDGSASLVGFGEGAGSTVSGPIYHRRPFPPTTSSAGAMAATNTLAWATLERTNSGLSDMAVMGSVSGASGTGATTSTAAPPSGFGGPARREFVRSPLEHFRDASGGGSSGGGGGGFLDSPAGASAAALQERREARLIDGMAADGLAAASSSSPAPVTMTDAGAEADDDVFIDTTVRGPVPVGRAASSTTATASPPPPPLMGSIIQAHPSALRETQRPRSHQQQQQNQYYHGMTREREAAEQLLQGVGGFEGYDGLPPAARTTRASARQSGGGGGGGGGAGNTGSGNNGGGGQQHLGRFYFEERR